MRNTTRREFLAGMACASLGLAFSDVAFAQSKRKTLLGFDNFSIRAFKWKAPQLIEYAASLKLDVVFLTDLDVYESFEETYLRKIKELAKSKRLQIYAGSWSICPTSKHFKNKWGSAEEHLSLGIKVAKTLGSPVFRCVLGMGQDRDTPGGI